MKKAVKWGLLAAVVVAVIAAIIAVVFVLVLKKKDERPSERVMYFAMHLGDDGALYRNRYEEYKIGMCNLKMNVDNTRSSIKAMKDLRQKYSFILFTDKIETTAPMSSDEAIQKLSSIEPKAHESPFNQESVLKEFAGRSGDNLLVYYIPCSFNYDHEKVKQFVGEMKKAGLEKKILIVSNTRTEGEVRQLYEQGNVAGSDTENVAEKIIDFGHGESKKSTLETKTSSKPGTTPKTSSKPGTTKTQQPTQSTKPTNPPSPSPNPNGLHCLFVGDLYNFGTRKENYDKEAALFGDIGYDFFEESSISRIGLWAYGHANYPKKPDLSNMNSNFEDFFSDLDNMEFQFSKDPMNTETAIGVINGLQDDGSMVNCLVFFSARQDTQSLPKLNPQNKKFKRIVAVGYNNTDLSGVVGSRGVAVSVPYHYFDSDVATIIDAIMGRPVTKTTPRTVPTRGPTTTTKLPPSADKSKCLLVGDMYNFGREAEKYDIEAELIASIGHNFFLDSDGGLQLGLWAYGYTQFSKTVNDSLKAMRRNYKDFEPDLDKLNYTSVSNPWSSESAIKAINEMYDTQNRVDCLVFFSSQQNPQNLPKLNPRNAKFSKIIAVGFNNVDLQHIVPSNGYAFKVPFHYLDQDITPIVQAMRGRAIDVINRLVDHGNSANCLVFISAQKDTSILPRLDPHYKKWERIVAVGFNDTDLSGVVYGTGVSVRVPFHYLDEHVNKVMDAIMGRYVPQTTKRPVTVPTPRPTTPVPPGTGQNCLLVADMSNFGRDMNKYEIEADLIADVAHDLYNGFDGSTIGLWAYGYTNFSKYAVTGLQNMRKNYDDFIKDLNGMVYYETDIPLSTAKAIEHLNRLISSPDIVNCLVFFSAEQDVSYLPYLNPVYLPLEVVVAVGLNDTDFSSRLNQEIGIPVSVPIHYVDNDVKAIVDAITEKEKPSPKPTTPAPTTTTEPPPSKDAIRCLFTGDLYNYGHNDEDYELEADLMDAVAHDLFQLSPQSSLGLWAFGYTNFSKDPTTSLSKIRRNYKNFHGDLDGFGYVRTSNPLDTKAAIEAINAMRDNANRINCLVFYSSTKKGYDLPKIDPEHLGLEKVVAVGLDDAKLNDLVPHNGVAVSVPKHFLDSHVTQIVNAIMRRPAPKTTTTKKPTTTARTEKVPDCLFVGDLYNFGENHDDYDLEAELMDAVSYDLFGVSSQSSLGLWAKNADQLPKLELENLGLEKVIAVGLDTPIKPYDCLIVGDLYNFGHNFDFYDIEADLIDAIGYDLFDIVPGSSLGLWAYGYSNFSTDPKSSLDKIRKNYKDFKSDVGKFNHYALDDSVVSTRKAIDALNALRDNGKRINCLVFLSGTRVADELPQLNPKNLKLDRIVAVGLNSQILDPLVAGHGVSVSVPEDFLDTHVKLVIDAIMGRIPPITTTKPATTTTPPPIPVDCLIVGDLYNFKDDEEAYETESDLIDAVGYDIFDTSPQSSLGLWAYGYTSFDKDPNKSKIRENYNDFKADLANFAYKKIDGPLTTKTAIEAINAMRDNSGRFKCLVFLSATKDTKGLPVINPQNLNLERIVAVGLNNANLDALVPYNFGISITPPPITPHCLFVADFLNFGDVVDDYDMEATLLDEVGYDLFDFDSKTSLGLWAYGYTNYSQDPNTSLEKMREKYADFEKDVNAMEYFKIANPLKTSKAIEAINGMRDNGNRINCLVFFSAIEDTKGLHQINPQHLNLERIVAVGLNGQPSNRRDCIVVTDFISFGENEESYEQEINFLSDLAFDFYGAAPGRTSMGLWVYGYTNFTNNSVNATLDNMKANFSEFTTELDKVEYHRIANPISTRDAIEQINRLHVTNERSNCMVFISGVSSTEGLPEINPNMPIDRFVAVGFNNTDLRRIIPNTVYARAVPVPIHFMDVHVQRVLEGLI
ncbi:hypothetical protein Aduo_006814 [Ancylostoma duodenale]